MQKLILDTNVMVSALISNAIPTRILYDWVLTNKVKPCLSEEVFEEYVEVLNRDKFARFSNFKMKAEIVLSRIKEVATLYYPEQKVDMLTDKSDNKFLELALISKADYLITGNTVDFTLSEFESTKIVTPRTYWEEHLPFD